MAEKPRILVAECMQEISSFNPLQSEYGNFHIERGDDMLAQKGINTGMGGALAVFDAVGFEPVLTISARAGSAGLLSRAGWTRLKGEVLEAIAAQARDIDGVYFSLHGAMAAEGELDPEGCLLAETRLLVGPDVPIVISLDLHGILTDRMLLQVDGLAIYHTYPHVDFAATGARAARVLHRLVTDRGLRPTIARVTIPALVRGDELITKSGCYGSLIREARRLELEGVAMSAGILIGNPFTDVPELCCQVIVATEGDAQAARQQALQLAQEFWPLRQRMQGKFSSLERAIAQARSIAGPVIFTDAADATSSGATGDSNLILRGLRDANYPKKVLAQIVDPDAAAVAHHAGVGATVQVTLGGAIDTVRFAPMPVTAQVRLLSDGRARLETMKIGLDAGPTAVLAWDNYTVVVLSRTVSLFDRAMYFANGLDPQDFHLIVVKSPHTEHHMFEAWADCNFNIDVPGATSANLPTLGHTICARPVYPLDPDARFDPQVALYQRR